MIRIHKVATPPHTLISKGKPATAAHRKAFAADRADYRSGAKTFVFDRDIYAADDVKLALRKAQADKCAFCEAKIMHITPGDVEHFRPKSAVKQAGGTTLEFPGYFWLAYDWGNLLLACSNCNRRHKGNLFPLVDPKKRCRSHRGKLSQERPLFINPASEDPEPHVEFVGETIRPRNGSVRGQTTIDELSLNRTELVEHRLTLLRLLRQLSDAREQILAVKQLTADQIACVTSIQNCLDGHDDQTAEYAAMARAFFR